MTTLIGIDAATKPGNIGLARGLIHAGKVVVEEVRLGSEVESIAGTVGGWIKGLTIIAVDAPLGWPAPMATALSSHRAGEEIAIDSGAMFARMTDHTVHDRIGKRPLEVGANLIARAALAALGLIEQIREESGLALPLLWEPGGTVVGFIEVYPAATLLSRGLATGGYKKNDMAGLEARRDLVKRLSSEVTLKPGLESVAAVDHILDAVLCVVAAADFMQDDVVHPPVSGFETTHKEGWIWFRDSNPEGP